MSYWTYINGTITVEPLGRTQAEKRYILETVLDHLPRVTGSEGDMHISIIQKDRYNSSSSCDEFGERTNNLVDNYGNKSRSRGWLKTQDEYILVIYGSFRDRLFEQTYREFMKWLIRLSKRVMVCSVLVNIHGYGKNVIINENDDYDNPYYKMFEDPSWCNNSGEPTWCEYLMWDRAKNSSYPMKLAYKYFTDEENDKEVEKRMNYERSD